MRSTGALPAPVEADVSLAGPPAVAGASIAAGMSMLIGLTAGNAALLITLAASASYIAVPAAMRLAVPEARPSISLGLALGITFPANILFGIPLYIMVARMLAPA